MHATTSKHTHTHRYRQTLKIQRNRITNRPSHTALNKCGEKWNYIGISALQPGSMLSSINRVNASTKHIHDKHSQPTQEIDSNFLVHLELVNTDISWILWKVVQCLLYIDDDDDDGCALFLFSTRYLFWSFVKETNEADFQLNRFRKFHEEKFQWICWICVEFLEFRLENTQMSDAKTKLENCDA